MNYFCQSSVQTLARSLMVATLCTFRLRLRCSFCYVVPSVCLTPDHLHQHVDSKVTGRARYTLLLKFDPLNVGRLTASPHPTQHLALKTLPCATRNTRVMSFVPNTRNDTSNGI